MEPGRPGAAEDSKRVGVGYSLDVVAPDVAAIVSGIGGWLCDRIRAGWKVRIVLENASNADALQILGHFHAPSTSIRRDDGEPAPSAIAIHEGLLAESPAVQGLLIEFLNQSIGEVVVFGERSTARRQGFTGLSYTLSPAARAFKCHARRAVGLSSSIGDEVENLDQAGPPTPEFASLVDQTAIEAQNSADPAAKAACRQHVQAVSLKAPRDETRLTRP